MLTFEKASPQAAEPSQGPIHISAAAARPAEGQTGARHTHPRRSGETGRRAGLKIPWEQSRAGSTPASGTKS